MTDLNLSAIDCLTRIGRVPENAAHADHAFPHLLGIELELENVDFKPDFKIPGGWTTHPDDSLRNGVEFVLAKPLSGPALLSAVTNFYNAEVVFKNTPRTSTHIHVNASDLTIGQVRTMFILSYILEDALFRVLEAKRKYCGYCMSLYEMPPQRLHTFLTTPSLSAFNNTMSGPNADKYYGFNTNSIRKHGTVEFRYFHGGPSKQQLLGWMQYCTSLKATALKVSLPELLAIADAAQLAQLLSDNLGAWGIKLTNAVGVESIFDRLQEIVGVFPEEGMEVRNDKLLFITEPFLNAVNKFMFPKASNFDVFKKRMLDLSVVSSDGWWDAIENYRMEYKADGAKIVENGEKLAKWAVENEMPQAPQIAADQRIQEYMQRMREIQGRAVRPVARPVPAPPPALRPRRLPGGVR